MGGWMDGWMGKSRLKDCLQQSKISQLAKKQPHPNRIWAVFRKEKIKHGPDEMFGRKKHFVLYSTSDEFISEKQKNLNFLE